MKTAFELKQAVAKAALAYLAAYQNEVIGMGTGSTINVLIDAIVQSGIRLAGAVPTSQMTADRLQAAKIPIYDLDAMGTLPVYFDGADEINANGHMIKGGGGALTREKMVASQARQFICLVDESKQVACLGKFPVPIEVLPVAQAVLATRLATFGLNSSPVHESIKVSLRRDPQNLTQPFVTENGLFILDVSGWQIEEPLEWEAELSTWPGIVTVGIFAKQRANLALVGTQAGVEIKSFNYSKLV
jgi:ribose 5-phosphate isomerase A